LTSWYRRQWQRADRRCPEALARRDRRRYRHAGVEWAGGATPAQAAKSDAKVIFLTMHADAQLATEAFRAGASGYVLKQSADEELIAAIQEVLRGKTYLTPLITKDVIATLTESMPQSAVTLTARQREVLRLIAEGKRMKEIGAILELSTRAVETHKYEIMRGLGVESTAEHIRYAIQIGLV
jgi:DNA-binding NarL/FixJ family response regulator